MFRPLGVFDTTRIVLFGHEAHQHLIHHTVCGLVSEHGTKTTADRALSFCETCWPTPRVYGGGRHRLTRPRRTLRELFTRRKDVQAIGTAKVS